MAPCPNTACLNTAALISTAFALTSSSSRCCIRRSGGPATQNKYCCRRPSAHPDFVLHNKFLISTGIPVIEMMSVLCHGKPCCWLGKAPASRMLSPASNIPTAARIASQFLHMASRIVGWARQILRPATMFLVRQANFSHMVSRVVSQARQVLSPASQRDLAIQQ